VSDSVLLSTSIVGTVVGFALQDCAVSRLLKDVQLA
jgi:hypothetical protein